MYEVTEQVLSDIDELCNFYEIENPMALALEHKIPKRFPEELLSEYNLWKRSKEYSTDYNTKFYEECARKHYITASSFRRYYNTSVGFVILDKEFISDLAGWIGKNKVLEVMAGTGALSKCLRDAGVDIVATTDNYSWNDTLDIGTWSEIENLDCADAVRKYGKEVKYILMSWPYMDDGAYRTLIAMREVNPEAEILYIGEDYGGCTANDNFFDTAEELEGPELTAPNPKVFDGIHDMTHLFK